MDNNIHPLPSARAPRRASPPSPVADFIRQTERRLRDDRPDCFEALRRRKPTIRDHLEDAARDPGFMFFFGGFCGVAITCASAIVAAGVLK